MIWVIVRALWDDLWGALVYHYSQSITTSSPRRLEKISAGDRVFCVPWRSFVEKLDRQDPDASLTDPQDSCRGCNSKARTRIWKPDCIGFWKVLPCSFSSGIWVSQSMCKDVWIELCLLPIPSPLWLIIRLSGNTARFDYCTQKFVYPFLLSWMFHLSTRFRQLS